MAHKITKILIMLPFLTVACAPIAPPTLMERAEERQALVAEFLAERGQGGEMAPVRLTTQAIFDDVRRTVGLSDGSISVVALEGAQFENAAILNDRVIVIGREFENTVSPEELRFVLSHELAHLLRPTAPEQEVDQMALRMLGAADIPGRFQHR